VMNETSSGARVVLKLACRALARRPKCRLLSKSERDAGTGLGGGTRN
jgi:hypothetical protein